MKKATLEELLARKERGKAEKMQIREVKINSINMSFTVVKQPLSRVLRAMDGYDKDGLADQYEMYKELIYMSVPLLQSKELQDAYECVEPTDIVSAVLEDNLNAVSEFGQAITELYGLGTETPVNDLKN